MAKECATPLNYLKGGVSVSPPPKIKGSKKLNRPNSNRPHYPKGSEKKYHNPNPLAHLVGRVNKAHILIDEVECLALIDSGAQISTIKIEFVKPLGLKIHQ